MCACGRVCVCACARARVRVLCARACSYVCACADGRCGRRDVVVLAVRRADRRHPHVRTRRPAVPSTQACARARGQAARTRASGTHARGTRHARGIHARTHARTHPAYTRHARTRHARAHSPSPSLAPRAAIAPAAHIIPPRGQVQSPDRADGEGGHGTARRRVGVRHAAEQAVAVRTRESSADAAAPMVTARASSPRWLRPLVCIDLRPSLKFK